MSLIKFRDWLAYREASAWTRLRQNAALGLMPSPPEASLHSRSTASPFQVMKLSKKKKKKKKKGE